MSSQKPHQVASNGFQVQTANYATARPRYPAESIAFIQTILPAKCKIVDLGAGTGIMTKFLVEDAHYDVTAVEPVAGMRQQLGQSLPDVAVVDGTSWNTTLPSESVDAVIVAQAFHWFDDLKTLQEVHRILKPGGTFLLIWNMESKKNSRWVERLRNLCEKYDGVAPQYRKGYWQNVWNTKEAAELFTTPLQHRHFDYPMPFNRAQVFPRILSRSYIAILPKDEHDKIEQQINAILDDPTLDFTTDSTGNFVFPHDTDLYWAQKK